MRFNKPEVTPIEDPLKEGIVVGETPAANEEPKKD